MQEEKISEYYWCDDKIYDKIDTKKIKEEITINKAGREYRYPEARNMPVEKAQNNPETQPITERNFEKYLFFISATLYQNVYTF